jgi:hypothetical protein
MIHGDILFGNGENAERRFRRVLALLSMTLVPFPIVDRYFLPVIFDIK